eukprot:s4950_g2.t1
MVPVEGPETVLDSDEAEDIPSDGGGAPVKGVAKAKAKPRAKAKTRASPKARSKTRSVKKVGKGASGGSKVESNEAASKEAESKEDRKKEIPIVWGPILKGQASLGDAPSGPGSPDVPDASKLVAPAGSQDDAVAEGDLVENKGPEPDLW